MIEEIKRQFEEDPLIKTDTTGRHKPDYAKCIAIST
jgi:Na+/H+-translocating membrane pyrophosphatase